MRPDLQRTRNNKLQIEYESFSRIQPNACLICCFTECPNGSQSAQQSGNPPLCAALTLQIPWDSGSIAIAVPIVVTASGSRVPQTNRDS
jgi:hypothetical protein